jgi:hypothetical protein
MPTDIELLYGTNNQAITITLGSLANNAARASTAIDNTTNDYEEIEVQFSLKSNAAGTSATGFCNIYATGTTDGGTTYGEGATGTDAAITLTSPPNVKIIGQINMVANATTYKSTPFLVSQGFPPSGVIPDHVVLIVENKSGAALDATEGNHTKTYQGVLRQVDAS